MDVVVEEVNRELLKEFNEGLVKIYLCKVKKNDEVVEKEVTKVVAAVNKELVKGPNLRILPKIVSWSAPYFWQTFGTRSSMALLGKMLFGQSAELQ